MPAGRVRAHQTNVPRFTATACDNKSQAVEMLFAYESVGITEWQPNKYKHFIYNFRAVLFSLQPSTIYKK